MTSEKLNAFLASVYEAALRAGEVAADAVYGLCAEAERQGGALKRRAQAAAVEGELEDKLQEVGQLIYGTHTGSPSDSDVLDEKLREVDALQARLDELRADLPSRCPACGRKVRPGDRFCGSCGGKL